MFIGQGFKFGGAMLYGWIGLWVITTHLGQWYLFVVFTVLHDVYEGLHMRGLGWGGGVNDFQGDGTFGNVEIYKESWLMCISW